MNSIVKHILIQNVVPVNCGEKYGSAFFISDEYLLTARHVVIEHLDNPDTPVYLYVNGELIECSATQLGEDGEKIDVAILSLDKKIGLSEIGLKLVASEFKEDMHFVSYGYPEEIGSFTAGIPLELNFICEIPNDVADIVLAKSSLISFFSYEGYSGAPVVNSMGSVCAILAIQENNNLRGVSIKKIREVLSRHNIRFTANSLFEDDTPTGLMRCKSILDTAISRAGDKYSPELHQRNEKLDDLFELFMSTETKEEYENCLQEAFRWAKSNPTLFGFSYSGSDTEDDIMKYFFAINTLDYKTIQSLNHEQRETRYEAMRLYHALVEAKDALSFSKKKIFGIFGAAGVGKSHMTCQLGVEYLNFENSVYYFHGSDLNASDDIETQIKTILNFDDNSLFTINEEAVARNKRVLFIIDAINEGPGFKYFQEQINKILRLFDDYESFKLLITGRRNGNGISEILEEYLEETFSFELHGFQNVDKALSDFANKYGIDKYWLSHNVKGVEFSNPLLLSMFCKSYYNRKFFNFESITRLDIYSEFITSRNETISEAIEEDPAKNVTLRAIKEIAKYSAFHRLCGNVEKRKAERICNRIVFRREWKKNLLRHLINENILYTLHDSEEYDRHVVDLEFQNFGDVFKAHAFLNSKLPLDDVISELIKISQKSNVDSENIENCISAILGLNKGKEVSNDIIKNLSEDIIFDALKYNNTHLASQIESLYYEKIPQMRITDLDGFINVFSEKFFDKFNEFQISIPLHSRDKHNILYINHPYEVYGAETLPLLKETFDLLEEDMPKVLFYFSWLYSSSHPEYRTLLLRHSVWSLSKHPEFCIKLLETFSKVDDAYILANVLCSIYGGLLISRNRDAATGCSKLIYEYFYSKHSLYPRNLLVRQWSLLILEFTQHLNPEADYFSKISFPLTGTENPLEWDLSFIDEDDFLGHTPGGERLKYNLFQSGHLSSDFNRYIIGTNYHDENPNFFTRDDKKIKLFDIEKMVAYEIKNLGWNDELGNLDTIPAPKGREDNKKEKIGKKYLWIAYQNVMALLSDHCQYNVGLWGSDNKIIGVRPWMVEGHSLLDPTLFPTSISNFKLPILTFKSRIVDFNTLMETENAFPPAIFEKKDDENQIWLQVDGWDNWYEMDGDKPKLGRNFHLQYIGWVVKDTNEEFIRNAINKLYFDASMMPLENEYEFLWNEYPWAERARIRKYNWEKFPDGKGESMPIRVCQLQEEMTAIEYEARPIPNAYAPNWEFMEKMGLYTAERGVIKTISDNEVVAFDRTLNERGCAGLIIRKDIVDTYLESVNGMLLIRKENYKSDRNSIRQYEWWLYCDGKFNNLDVEPPLNS